MSQKKQKQLKLTLKKSIIGRKPYQVACVKGLGLKKTNHTVHVIDTPENRGMINKVHFMLNVEEV